MSSVKHLVSLGKIANLDYNIYVEEKIQLFPCPISLKEILEVLLVKVKTEEIEEEAILIVSNVVWRATMQLNVWKIKRY